MRSYEAGRHITAADDGTDSVLREESTGLRPPLIWRGMPDLQPSPDTVAGGPVHAIGGAR